MIKIIPMDPNLSSATWELFSKEGLMNRHVMFSQPDDAALLLNALQAISPDFSYFCRNRLIGSSMSNVYGVTLPQFWKGPTDKMATLALSKTVKHFAVKIIAEQDYLDNEVNCLSKICDFLENNCDVDTIDVERFYALGYWKGGQSFDSITSFTPTAMNFSRNSPYYQH